MPPVPCRECQGITQPRVWSAPHTVSCRQLWARRGAGTGDSLSCPSLLPEGKTQQSLLQGGFQMGAMVPQGQTAVPTGVAPLTLTREPPVSQVAPSCTLKAVGRGSQQTGEWTAGVTWLDGASSRAAVRLQRGCAASVFLPRPCWARTAELCGECEDSFPILGPSAQSACTQGF
uniref:Uncharacterized protein n=1 Tax=Molossus molossus TaxID=27622 RepID=A0A7J8F9U3_MOLMO|nr:hypothetical protein HJG59_008464 [Molossus molossus]